MLVDCIDICKKFSTKTILENVSFSIHQNDKIAIIGKNGQGKSSLLKIITNELNQDSGRVIIKNDISISMLNQEPKIDLNLSVEEVIKDELKEIFSLLKEYEKINEQIALDPTNKELLSMQSELSDKIESKDAWSINTKIKKIVHEFSLEEFMCRSANTLSGGELRRVMLATLLLKNPDILLLDEPTNHLDVHMCEFLENYLKASKMCVVFISHDRYFIENVASVCFEIENGVLRRFEGGYSSYLEQKQKLLESMLKSHETLVKQLKSEEEWLRRGVKARLKRNEGRKERIFKMREEAKKNPGILNRLKIEILRAGKVEQQLVTQNRKKQLFLLENAGLKYGDKVLFDGFDVRILQGEKIAIVGKNGCGKSSFLKCLLGEEKLTSGVIKHADINIGYFSQSKNYDADVSLLEYFCPNGGDHIQVHGKNMHVYGYLKKFLFPEEYLSYKLSSLSGGERTKVALAKLFTREYEVLILDEPTNDLDIATINILEEYLMNFEGALLFVSHDRYFVDKLSSKLFAFEDGKISIETMNYSEYLELLSEMREIKEYKDDEQKITKQKQGKKLSYKQNLILSTYPDKIEKYEQDIKELERKLADPNEYQKYGISVLSDELDNLKAELEKLEEEYFLVLEESEELE